MSSEGQTAVETGTDTAPVTEAHLDRKLQEEESEGLSEGEGQGKDGDDQSAASNGSEKGVVTYTDPTQRYLGDAQGGDNIFGVGLGAWWSQKAGASSFFLLNGRSTNDVLEIRGWKHIYESAEEWSSDVIASLRGERVPVRTVDGRILDAIWAPAGAGSGKPVKGRLAKLGRRSGENGVPEDSPKEAGDDSGPTAEETPPSSAVILFHANAQVNLDLVMHAKWYKRRGIGALLVTMGGYGESQGFATEISSYVDAQACLQWLKTDYRTGVSENHQVIAHGFSIGGALAAALAERNPGVHCCLDQGFLTGFEAARNVINANVSGGSWLPNFTLRPLVNSILVKGVRQHGYITDGYDNASKMKNLRGNTFFICADQDIIAPSTSMRRLFTARYSFSEGGPKDRESTGGIGGFFGYRPMITDDIDYDLFYASGTIQSKEATARAKASASQQGALTRPGGILSEQFWGQIFGSEGFCCSYQASGSASSAAQAHARLYGMESMEEKLNDMYRKRFIMIQGKHGSFFGTDERASQLLEDFLIESNLMVNRRPESARKGKI